MDHRPRLFADDATIRSIGERMIACRLPKPEWTHEAHLSTCAWIIIERADITPERDLPILIRRYNESVGGVNDETQGYHETITQVIDQRRPRRAGAERGKGAGRAGQRAAGGAGGAAGLAAAVLFARAAVLEGGAAGVGGARSGATGRLRGRDRRRRDIRASRSSVSLCWRGGRQESRSPYRQAPGFKSRVTKPGGARSFPSLFEFRPARSAP